MPNHDFLPSSFFFQLQVDPNQPLILSTISLKQVSFMAHRSTLACFKQAIVRIKQNEF